MKKFIKTILAAAVLLPMLCSCEKDDPTLEGYWTRVESEIVEGQNVITALHFYTETTGSYIEYMITTTDSIQGDVTGYYSLEDNVITLLITGGDLNNHRYEITKLTGKELVLVKVSNNNTMHFKRR